jgi:hypothetical protein
MQVKLKSNAKFPRKQCRPRNTFFSPVI